MDRATRTAKVVFQAPESALPADRLLDLNTIRNASRKPPEAICGVYFLWKGSDLIYVGKSVNLVCRLLNHSRQRDFDSYSVVECQEGELADLETAYILLLKPPQNGAQNEYPEAMRLFTYKSPEEWRAHYLAQKATL
mgnify:CR=1 FL=1